MSPKNKGKFGRGKPSDIPETDEFISGVDRVVRALKPHAIKLAVFLGVIAVIVVSFSVWQWWGQRKASAATRLYAQAVALSQVRVSEQAPEPDARVPPDPRNLPRHFPTRADRAKAVLAALDELDAKSGKTGVAQQGRLLAAAQLLELGRHADAADRYRGYLKASGSPELAFTAREGLAYALEGKAVAEKDAAARQAGLEKALAAFEKLEPSATGPRLDQALFHQARILGELGRIDEAVERFEKILSDHPSSSLKEDVELRLLALRSQPER